MPRKKKAETSPEPQPFTVGEAEAPSSDFEEKPASLSEESENGLLSLRGHLSQFPTPLLWPLQTLPNLTQHMSDLASAGEAVDKAAIRHAMSTSKLAELREFLLSDAYAFTYLICNHRQMVPEVHMAMCYAAAGQAGKLAWLLTQSGFDGYVIEQFRKECASKSIDIRNVGGIYALDQTLNWINLRLPRGVYKSSTVTHGGATITATADPDTTAQITAAKDEKAEELIGQVGKTVTSGIYRDFFPDRVPAAARDVSKNRVTINGRTISHPQTTIQADSYISKEIGGHFDRFWIDDLVVRGAKGGNATPTHLPGVHKWLSGMRGFVMLTPKSGRVRRVHVGTIATTDDDSAWLTHKKRRARIMTVCVPIETFPEGYVPANPFERGTPTMPTFPPVATPERITEMQLEVVADESEAPGMENWLCDYMLIPAADGGQLFDAETVNDPDRTWLGPYEHPDRKLREREPHRFMLARFKRNDDGQLLDRNGKALDVKTDGWRKLVALETFDPWSDLDRIVTLNTTWASGGKRWALTVSGVDPQLTRFQLETRAGDGGANEWADALRDIAKLYKPRVIGLDRKAHADCVVQNMLKTDKRLLGLRSRVVGVDQQDMTEESRIRASVSEPLKTYKLMLLAASEDTANDYGASITRKELLMFRAGSDKAWPILDSIAMTAALMRAVPTKEERHKIEQRAKEAGARARREYDPMIGGPRAA